MLIVPKSRILDLEVPYFNCIAEAYTSGAHRQASPRVWGQKEEFKIQLHCYSLRGDGTRAWNYYLFDVMRFQRWVEEKLAPRDIFNAVMLIHYIFPSTSHPLAEINFNEITWIFYVPRETPTASQLQDVWDARQHPALAGLLRPEHMPPMASYF